MARLNFFILFIISSFSWWESSQALDIGEAIKNLVKGPDVRNDDASTGTITSVVEKEYPKANSPSNPVTCDDLLAQAVVRSNEQKLVALTERDAALLSAANATVVSNEYMKKLTECEQSMMQTEEKIRMLEEQYQKLQNESEQTMELMKLEAERVLTSTIEKSESEILTLQNKTTSQIEKITNECEQIMERVQLQAKDEVSRTHQDSQRRIIQLQQKYDEHVGNLTEAYKKEEQRIEQERIDAMNEIQLQMESLKIETANQLSACQIQALKREEQILHETDKKLGNLEQRAKKTQLIQRAQLSRVQLNAEQALAQQREDSGRINLALERATEEKIQNISLDMESQLVILQKQLDDEKALVSKLTITKESLEENLSKVNQKVDQSDLALYEKYNQMKILESQLNETMTMNSKLVHQVHSLESFLLEKDILIQIWESKPKTYVNVTLVKEDFSTVVDLFIVWSRKSMIRAYKISRTKVEYLITNAPDMAIKLKSSMKYGLQNYDRVTAFYYRKVMDKLLEHFARLKESPYLKFFDGKIATEAKRHIKEYSTRIVDKVKPSIVQCMAIIEEKAKPVLKKAVKLYESNVVPAVNRTNNQLQDFVRKYIIPAISKSQKTLIKYGTVSQKSYRKGRSICAQKLIKGAKITIERVMSIDRFQESSDLRSITLNSLEDIRDNASFYVDAATALIAVLFVLRCRYLILNLIKIVFRIVWFFFPVRFLFSSRISSRDRENKNNTSLNGHSRHSEQ